MDLNRVAAFVRVVQDGSFTSAAKSLGLPKSSISRSVAQLEQELGLRLLHRTTRQLNLTEAGSAFFERASRALVDLNDARSAAADSSGDPSGRVRLTAPVDFGVSVLAAIVTRFARKHPRIVVEAVLTSRMVDLVSEGIDLAVRMGALRDSSLVGKRIGPLRSALYAAPKYLARKGAPATLDDLARHCCIVFRQRDTKSTWTLERRGEEKPKTVEVSGPLVADDLEFVKKATLLGGGIGLLPEFIADRAEERGQLVRILPK